MGTAGALRAVEGEIVGERAGAMARAMAALEAALEVLAVRPDREALAEARERLWFVVVQREALNLRHHEVLYEVLRVPPEVRLGLGPRPRPARAATGDRIPSLFGG